MKANEMSFLKKECADKMYEKIRKMLIEEGYKPLNNITHKYTSDCKETKHSFLSPYYAKYPYTITIHYQTLSTNPNRLAA